jgi:hypothetical protein
MGRIFSANAMASALALSLPVVRRGRCYIGCNTMKHPLVSIPNHMGIITIRDAAAEVEVIASFKRILELRRDEPYGSGAFEQVCFGHDLEKPRDRHCA